MNRLEKISILILFSFFVTITGILMHYHEKIKQLEIQELIIRKQILDSDIAVPFGDTNLTRITLHPSISQRDTINLQIIIK